METTTHPHFSHIVLDCSQYNQHQQSSQSDICYGSLGVPWDWGNRLKNKGFTILKENKQLHNKTAGFFYFKNTPWRELEPDASRNCFWDGYWEHAGQLLANFFPLPTNSPRPPCEI